MDKSPEELQQMAEVDLRLFEMFVLAPEATMGTIDLPAIHKDREHFPIFSEVASIIADLDDDEFFNMEVVTTEMLIALMEKHGYDRLARRMRNICSRERYKVSQ